MTVDLVNVDLVNDDVSMGHAEVIIPDHPDDIMLMSACHVARPKAATCHCFFMFSEILLLFPEMLLVLENL